MNVNLINNKILSFESISSFASQNKTVLLISSIVFVIFSALALLTFYFCKKPNIQVLQPSLRKHVSQKRASTRRTLSKPAKKNGSEKIIANPLVQRKKKKVTFNLSHKTSKV